MTGLEPATSGVTGRHSNQLSYTRVGMKGLWPLKVERGNTFAMDLSQAKKQQIPA